MLSTTSKSASNLGLQTPTISGLVLELSPYGLGLVSVLTPRFFEMLMVVTG